MPKPNWSPMKCKLWILGRRLKPQDGRGVHYKLNKQTAIAKAAQPELKRIWSRTGADLTNPRPAAYKEVDNEPECTPEFAEVLTRHTGIKPNDCQLSGAERLRLRECDLLNQFGQCMVGLNPECMWMLGPVKGLGRMAQKAVGQADYDFDLSGLKDNFRGSIACPDKYFDKCRATIDTYLQSQYGLGMVGTCKNKFGDPKFNGYGDITYFIVFRESPSPCELQLHKSGMLFGKMSKTAWVSSGLESFLNYDAKEQLLGIPGGLGHILLEIPRGGYSARIKAAAAELSRQYYPACNAEGRASDQLRKQITDFAAMMPWNWKHHGDFVLPR
jgi:hypothetical protein